jgi:hypothetical protein
MPPLVLVSAVVDRVVPVAVVPVPVLLLLDPSVLPPDILIRVARCPMTIFPFDIMYNIVL